MLADEVGCHGLTTTFSAPPTRSVNVRYASPNCSSGNVWVISSPSRTRPAATSAITSGISPAAARTPDTSISSSTSRCSGIRASSCGMPITATRPPLRTAATHWPSAAGSPEHSSATSGPCPPVRSRSASTGSSAVKSTTSCPSSAALASRAPRPTTITRPAPSARAHSATSRPITPGPTTATVSPGAWPPRLTVCSAIAAGSSIAASASLSASGTGNTLRTECTT